jgi:uncharacterized protein YcfJ
MSGAAMGTSVMPGVGTIIGGIFGAISGAISGSYGTGYIVNSVGDEFNYDLVTEVCEHCCKEFKVRKYLDEKESVFCSSQCEKQHGECIDKQYS